MTKRYLACAWRRPGISATPASESRLGGRESKAYRAARGLPQSKPRDEAFNACRDAHGFLEYAEDRVQGQYAYGGRGRPRYKRRGWLTSVAGKSNAAGIRWRDGSVLWSGLTLMPVFDIKDKHGVCPVLPGEARKTGHQQ